MSAPATNQPGARDVAPPLPAYPFAVFAVVGFYNTVLLAYCATLGGRLGVSAAIFAVAAFIYTALCVREYRRRKHDASARAGWRAEGGDTA